MNKVRALIIGKGLLGNEVIKQAKKFTDWEVITSDVIDGGGLDITKEESIAKWFEEIKPDIVINCAAFTNVDACETPEGFEIAKKVNGYGPGLLAKYTIKHGCTFIHISTDYVFGDNRKEGYQEDYNIFKPLNKYGESKLLGEKEVLKYLKPQKDGELPLLYILRTSWLFGEGARNFLGKMLELSEGHNTLRIVTDEVSSPTYVKDLAQRLIYIVESKPQPGIYHVSGKGAASRYDFAKVIFKYAKKDIKIEPTTLAEFQRKTAIPNYSVLLNTKLPAMRNWEEMVKDFFDDQALTSKT